MEKYRVFCLGRPVLEFEGKPVKLEMRKSLALLIYLRFADHDYSRETISTLFWPEYSQQRALANLRRVLSSLNKSLDPSLLAADREKIGLKDRTKVWLDVDEFQKTILATKNHTHANDHTCPDCLHLLEDAVRLYQGDFMEGFNLGDCPEFDDWQFLQRENIRQEFARVLQRVAEAWAAREDWEQAIAYTRRWVALDRLHEPAQRFLIYLYDQAGQRNASLRQYDEFVKILFEELGQEPEPETTDLYQRIRDGTAAMTQASVKVIPNERIPLKTVEPLLKTKLYIPSSRGQKVYREHLIQKLNLIKQYPLTILSAPAGFGKTTTLIEWASQSSLPIGWYSLDSGDNEVVRFLSYLIAALESIQSEIGIDAHVQSLLRAPQSTPPHLILTHILHNLESLKTPSVLVLDDYQFISSQIIHDALNFFLENLPPNLHLIIATRADPSLGLARLRSQGLLLEIRLQDLRFTFEEAFEFLTGSMGLPLTANDVSLLDQRIEGWVVGFQMAAIALQSRRPELSRAEISQFIHSFSGSHRYILDYLTEEVLSRQSKIVYEFLLKTSILERLSSPVCDAVLGIWDENLASQKISSMASEADSYFPFESSQQILEYLERSNLFIIALDDERRWYRFHHLFTDLLHARLQNSLGAHGITQLHLRACEWHEQNGLILDAIHHASMASDEEEVERLIEQNYMEMVNRGEMSWLRFWTGKLSKELIYKRPWLCIYEAQNHAWYGELDEADQLLAEAEKRIGSKVLATDIQSMQGHLAYVRSRVTAMRGDIHKAIGLCLTAREHILASNLAMQLDISMTLGYEYFLNGDYVNANPSLNQTIQSCNSAGAIINTIAAHCVLARLFAIQGLLKKSYGLYQSAEQLIPQESGHHLGARALVAIGFADVLYEWNDLEAALAHLTQGLALMPYWGKADDFILAYATLARIHLAQVNIDGAIETVEKAVSLIQTRGVFPEARNAVEITRVILWLKLGEIARAAEWLEKYQANHHESIQIWRECEDIISTRVLLALGRSPEAQVRLAQLSKSAEERQRTKRLIEILILQALAFDATENQPEALDILQKALTLAQPEGYIRIFLDEGKPLSSLLTYGVEQGFWDTSPLNEYVSTLLNAFEREKNSLLIA